jgi:hypothetical protein
MRQCRPPGIVAVVCAVLLVVMPGVHPRSVLSEPIANTDFLQTWTREDQPVAAGQVSRSWLWGPDPFTAAIQEPYGSSPGGERTVQYFDKARMEINDPDAERNRWFVTTGLLASEMMSGAMQTADGAFVQRGPALIPVAGDLEDPEGPTYATFDTVRHAESFPTGTTLVTRIDRVGTLSHDQQLARHNVLAGQYVPETSHSVASVFWTFLNATAVVVEDSQTVTGRLFEPWFYATGFPVTEAYWTSARVDGIQQDVLVQVFERRVLTYTPSNEPAWRVELGNVGLHYYWWRYQRDEAAPITTGQILWTPDLTRVSESDGWSVEGSDTTIVARPGDAGHDFALHSHVWHGGAALPQEDYRASVDVQMSGTAEAGIGFYIEMADSGLRSMVYFGADRKGIRHATLEGGGSAASRFLLRPVGGLSGWNADANAWTTIAVRVSGGQAWLSVNEHVVGHIDLPPGESIPGIALVSGFRGDADDSSMVTFRNLTVEALTLP